MPLTDPAGSRPVGDVIEPHLLQARWFAGKGRQASLRALVPLPWLESSDLPAVRLEVAEIEYATAADAPGVDGAEAKAADIEYYLLALCYRAPADAAGPGLGVATHPELGPVSVHPVLNDPGALDVILRFVSGDHELSGQSAGHKVTLTNHLIDGSRLRVGLHPRPFGGEQSNTSIRYGEVALLKLFRRLEIGHNLDIEVHRELTDGAAQDRIAALYGWLDASWTDSRGASCQADLGMLVEQLGNARDGWEVALAALAAGEDFTDHATELGRALRQVHTGLADAFGTDTVPGVEPATVMRARVARTAREVPAIAPLSGPLDSRLFALDALTYPAQRVHGDFHLGQTLLAGDDPGDRSWRIIDFEGEPLKGLAERRTLDTPWRDVAGMLRSLAYAGGYAERTFGVSKAKAEEWVAAAGAAFVRGYAGRDLTKDEQIILRSYQIDKAVYECLYEARNRPDWLPIPLSALTTLVGETDSRNDGGIT